MSLELIARGRTAEVYGWEAGKVVKLYRPGFGTGDADYEAKIATVVQESGVACSYFYEQAEVEGRPGLIYERIDGIPMSEMVLKAPWRIPALARRMAVLHRQMHQPKIDAPLPMQREKYTWRIEHSDILPAPLKSRLLEAYTKIPDKNHLCHGDFHPGNILSTAEKDLAIDWIDVSVGHPFGGTWRAHPSCSWACLPRATRSCAWSWTGSTAPTCERILRLEATRPSIALSCQSWLLRAWQRASLNYRAGCLNRQRRFTRRRLRGLHRQGRGRFHPVS